VSYLLQLPKLFWLVNLTILGNEIVMNIYTNLNDLIVNRFNIGYVTAGKLLLIPYTLGSVFSLLFGRILTLKPTLRRKMVVATCVLISLAMLMLFLQPNVSEGE
jgi:MFS family permease